jgi:acetolactate decarboxylase
MNLTSFYRNAGRAIALTASIALLPALASATGKMIQLSTLSALSAGVFDGEADTMNVLQRPDAYGLGTFDKLDGEMIVKDGVAYRVGSDGKVTKPAPDTAIPFAAISVLDTPDVAADLGAFANRAEVEKFILSKLPSLNYPVLIVIDGRFTNMKTRSVPAQHKPYGALGDVCATQQKVFELGDQEGTVVGFYCPSYMAGFEAVGFHLHFLNSSHDAGGHVLDFAVTDGKLRLQIITGFQAILPKPGSAFAESDLEPPTANKAKAAPAKTPGE